MTTTTTAVVSPSPSTPVGQLLAVLAACVCAGLREAGRPVCACCLLHSADLMPMTGCDCGCGQESGTGRLNARVLGIEPYGANTAAPTDECGSAVLLQVTLQFGVFRCVTVPESGEPPSCEIETAEALGFLTDAEIMRRAVACCPDKARIPGRWQVIPGQWEPRTAMGGCAGGVLTVTAYGHSSMKPPTSATGARP